MVSPKASTSMEIAAKGLQRAVVGADLFPYTYSADRERTTVLGGSLTIITVLLLVIYSIVSLVSLVRSPYTITRSMMPLEPGTVYDLELPSIGFSIYDTRAEDDPYDGFVRQFQDPDFISVSFNYMVVTDMGSPVQTSIPLVECQLGPENGLTPETDRVITGYCPDPDSLSGGVRGRFFTGDFRLYEFSISVCQNGTRGTACQPPTAELWATKSIRASVWMQHQVDGTHNKVWKRFTQMLDLDLEKRFECTLAHATAITDSRYFGLDGSTKSFTAYDDTAFAVQQASTGKVFSVAFSSSAETSILIEHISPDTLLNLISGLGGLFAGAQGIAMLVVLFWKGDALENEFEARLGRHENKFKIQKQALEVATLYAKKHNMTVEEALDHIAVDNEGKMRVSHAKTGVRGSIVLQDSDTLIEFQKLSPDGASVSDMEDDRDLHLHSSRTKLPPIIASTKDVDTVEEEDPATTVNIHQFSVSEINDLNKPTAES